jgi:predicted oxidoreductase
LLKHPAGIVPIVGSTNRDRIEECAAAASIEMPREEWYRLLAVARGVQLP